MGNCLGNPEIQVLAVCDVDTTRRELAKEAVEEAYGTAQGARYQGCAAYNDFRELIARKDIDAVMIATPDHWHAIIAQWGLGEDGRGPVEIIPPAGWEDAKEGVRLIYANGIPLTHDGKGSGVSFFGQDGEVHVGRGKFKFILKGKPIHQFWDKDTDEDTSVSREVSATERDYLANAKLRLYNSPNHYADWLTSMKTRKPPISDVAIGASSVISCHLVNLAYYHGARMNWDPVQHTFVSGGDPKWLTREYRGEWKV